MGKHSWKLGLFNRGYSSCSNRLFGILNEKLVLVLVVLGLIVGFLNVADEETTPFLLSGVVLIIASSLGGDVMSKVPYVSPIREALLVLFVPATIIVAIKNVFKLARN